MQLDPPRDLTELRQRADALAGLLLEELAPHFASDVAGSLLRRKGKAGQLIERALGATAGSLPEPDFAALGVELKTIPIDEAGRPRESTFVCTLSLRDAEMAEWHGSTVQRKLAHVLFVPIHTGPRGHSPRQLRIGRAMFWQPSAEQAAQLRQDFDDIMGLIALGRIESLTARIGEALQVRPKAAHGGVRTRAYGFDDEPISAMPRGFYLRARFTATLLGGA